MKAIAVGLLLGLSACLSSAPPAPPVRFFDVRPASPVTVRAMRLRVEAAAWLGQDFVVRTAAREVTFDGEHRWLENPAGIVAGAMRAIGPTSDRGEVVVRIERFELDLTAGAAARVELALSAEPMPAVPMVAVVVAAADRSPAALAAAMAEAVAGAAKAVSEAFAH